MVTTRPGISVEAEVWERFRTEVEQGKRSAVLESLMKEYLEIDNSNIEDLKQRLSNKHDDLEDLQKEKSKIDRKISKVESDISTIRSAIQERERQEETEKDEWNKFLEIASNSGLSDRDWTNSQKIYWKKQLNMEWKDIVDKAEKEVEA